jgi:hypothetical protein
LQGVDDGCDGFAFFEGDGAVADYDGGRVGAEVDVEGEGSGEGEESEGEEGGGMHFRWRGGAVVPFEEKKRGGKGNQG